MRLRSFSASSVLRKGGCNTHVRADWTLGVSGPVPTAHPQPFVPAKQAAGIVELNLGIHIPLGVDNPNPRGGNRDVVDVGAATGDLAVVEGLDALDAGQYLGHPLLTGSTGAPGFDVGRLGPDLGLRRDGGGDPTEHRVLCLHMGTPLLVCRHPLLFLAVIRSDRR
jgi:hypothetical protein